MGNGFFNNEQSAEAYLSEITYLLQLGKKIEAIKVYRQATGSDLATAKRAIENLEATGMLNMVSPPNGSVQPLNAAMFGLPEAMLAEIGLLLQRGKKIEAIKFYRQQTGTDLATAKGVIDRVEGIMQSQGF